MLRYLDRERFELVPVSIDKDGRWQCHDLRRIEATNAESLPIPHDSPAIRFEPQGALTALVSLAGIIGPPAYSYVFALFISHHAPAHLPGAPWLLASLLLACAWLVGWGYARQVPARP